MRNPFRRPSEADKRIAAVRADLQAARDGLMAIDAERSAALENSVLFAAWSTKKAAAAAEVDRLSQLCDVTEAAAADAGKAEADEARRRERDAAHKAAEVLAGRIRTEGAAAMTTFLTLAKDCAAQSLIAERLNADLRDGETPVLVAEIVARDHGAEDRKDLKSRVLDLWVVADDGRLVGDQSAVASSDGVTGQLHLAGAAFRFKCVRRKFREVEFHPATLTDWPGALSSLIRLPSLTGPGVVFDGALMTPEAVASLDVAALFAPRKKHPRPTQIELVPVDPSWPPADATAEADQAS